jgi:hypothetical protein
MRASLIPWCAWCACALMPAAASEALVSREQALGDLVAQGEPPLTVEAAVDAKPEAPGLAVAQQLDQEGGELIVTVIRASQAHHERGRAAVYLSDQANAGRYRLLMRIHPAREPGPGFSPPQILHPFVAPGPGRVWLVRLSTATGGDGGWMEERLLSLRRSGAGSPALDEVDFVSAPQAYQPFLAPGEAVLSAEWDDFTATPMAFRFFVWGPHDPHVDPRGGVVTGSYRLLADAARPGCYRLDAERFDRVAAEPRAER